MLLFVFFLNRLQSKAKVSRDLSQKRIQEDHLIKNY